MTKWIRWSGLIGFLLLAALVAAFLLLAAGPLVRLSIESLGSRANGARVEVGDVSVSFSPFGLRLQQLQVADARQPMRNAVQFDQALAQLEIPPLLLGKVIVRELSVDGLRFGTARTTSGALPAAAPETQGDEAEAAEATTAGEGVLSQVDLPDADELLAREPLRTDAAGKAFRERYDHHQALLDERLAAVPDAAALQAYEREVKALTSGRLTSLEDFNQRRQQLQVLQERFRQDQQAISAARAAVADARSDLQGRLQALRAAPGEDLATIRTKYQLDAAGAANLSALLFGADAGRWATEALYWYEKVRPYLSRGEPRSQTPEAGSGRPRDGRFIAFPTADPWPDMLLREARLTAQLDSGRLLIDARDITHQQALLGRPLQVVVNGELPQVDDLTLEAVLDHRRAPGKDSLTLTVKDWQAQTLALGLGETELRSARVQVQAVAEVSQQQLQASGRAEFGQAEFHSAGKTLFAKELGSALNSIKAFRLEAEASGALTSPAVSLRSDLDQQLSQAFSQRLTARQRELEQRLQQKLQSRLQGHLGEHAGVLNQLNAMEGGLDTKLQTVRSLASREVADYAEQQKQEARAEAERKQKEAEAKAKEKLKKLF